MISQKLYCNARSPLLMCFLSGLTNHLCAFLCLVKIQQALMSMQQKTTVGEIHDVTLIMYRD